MPEEQKEIIADKPTKKSRVRRIALRILLVFAVLFLLLTSAAFVAAYYYGDEIESAVIGEVNERLNIGFDVKDINISVFRHFPYAAIEIQDVISKEEMVYGEQPHLLTAEKINLLFNLTTLLGRDIEIKKIEIENASLNLIELWNKGNNYEIFKPSSSRSDSAFIYQLAEVILINTSISYRDHSREYNASFIASPLKIKGALLKNRASFDVDGKVQDCSFSLKGKSYLENEDLEVSIPLVYKQVNDILELGKCRLNTRSQDLTLEGTIYTGNDDNTTQLLFAGSNTALENIRNYLPDVANKFLSKIEPGGNIEFEGKYVFVSGKAGMESVDIDFSLNRGNFHYKDLDLELHDAEIKGGFSYKEEGGKNETSIDLHNIVARLGRDEVSARISYKEKGLKTLKVMVTSDLDFTELKKVLQPKGIIPMDGRLMVDLQFMISKQDLSKISYLDFKENALEGRIEYKDIQGRIEDAELDMKKLSGSIHLKGNIAECSLNGKLNGNSFNFDGSLFNLLPSIFSGKETLEVEGNFQSEKINLEDFMGDEGAGTFGLSSAPLMDLEIRIDELIKDRFKAENIKGHLSVLKDYLYVEGMELETMNGVIRIDGGISQENNKNYRGECVAGIKDINIKEMFRQLDNFGQTNLTSKHLEGLLSGSLDLSLVFDSYWNILPGDVAMKSKIRIERGEVKNYKPLLDLAKFIKAGDLSHVIIEPLENEILIYDKVISIPEMEVKTNAINLSISGMHNFNNEIDYHFKVLLSELLGKKARKEKLENQEFGYIEEDGLGQTTLFLHLTGTTENPDFKYDKKEVSNKIKEDFKEEKKSMRKVLQNEFNWLVGDSLQRKERKKERKKLKKQEEGKFIIDWDEE